MTQGKAEFRLAGHNPDVLTCIANLSNDEVFTPPEFANRMLDSLELAWAESNGGSSIWADPTVTFLDPFTKSGVFLREITARLTEGLAEQIPDLQDRVDHILTRQVFGIGITTLTSLLARRSVYCSKNADGPHSIARSFDRAWGNIWFERTEHTWAGDRCAYCGAAASEYARDTERESHAYAFIHTSDIRARMDQLFGATVQFDVIIGNPPYQMSDGGNNASAMPIYQLFAEQAKALEPRFLSLVIPARWYAGGKGLDGFRQSMVGDGRVRELHDFFSAEDVFPGVDISGGICYFLWARDNPGPVRVVSYRGGEVNALERPSLADEGGTIVRFNEGIRILDKVRSRAEERFADGVSARKPFGIPTNVRVSPTQSPGDVRIFAYPSNGFVSAPTIERNRELVDRHKVLISYVYGERGSFPYLVIGKPFIAEPGTCCSETYLIARVCDSAEEAQNVASYMRTRLFRFLVLLAKNTQHATSKVYTFVPTQDFSRPWTDADLYAKYGITDDEVAFIESMVRPMEPVDA